MYTENNYVEKLLLVRVYTDALRDEHEEDEKMSLYELISNEMQWLHGIELIEVRECK